MTLLAFIAPETARNILLIVAGIAYLAYHLVRWWRNEKSEGQRLEVEGQKSEVEGQRSEVEGQTVEGKIPLSDLSPMTSDLNCPPPQPSTSTTSPGADLYRRARAMMHQRIPDYRVDGLYLDLLGDSAEQGYAPAMQKLGDYAMRRGTLVEAYYWFWRAKRQGALNLDTTLREIRRTWTLSGTPDEGGNVSPIFDVEAGSIARALLNIDSGRNAAAARKFLKEHHPEFFVIFHFTPIQTP